MKQTDIAAEHFIEQMGLQFQADSLPRIAGRIFGLLIMEDGPHGFSELAERLGVSRGSISTNARLLDSMGLVERVSKPGDRQDYYRIAGNPYGRLMKGVVDRMVKARGVVAATKLAVPECRTGCQQRLADLDRFYELTIRAFNYICEAPADAAAPLQELSGRAAAASDLSSKSSQ